MNIEVNKEVYFLDYVEKYHLLNLNVLTKVRWTKLDKTTIHQSHPHLETIIVSHRGTEVIVS